MSILSNAHTHCTWCDGAATPCEMADAALALGFTDLGFSSHSPTPFDPTCPGVANEQAYRSDIMAVRQQYNGRLGVLCGMEQDYYAPVRATEYDYIIGSVHFLPPRDGRHVAVDGNKTGLLRVKNEWYSGNGIALAQDFYDLTAKSARRYRPAIVGHFDLVTKYNMDGSLFDEDNAAYKSAALAALDDVMDVCGEYGGMIEVNTGAIGRGVRDIPYPAAFLLRHLAQRDARVIVTSDSHAANTLDCGFELALQCMRDAGLRSMAVLCGGKFVDVNI